VCYVLLLLLRNGLPWWLLLLARCLQPLESAAVVSVFGFTQKAEAVSCIR
jgi:hypothetical protein